ncbi:flagellar hook-basal body proteins [Terriglobus roseus DSM 18391]|uniref:Flagellar hook protein FlgE n=1 Tax=Terriglobus roseus (strain DSM 18391 / NRRL B-41598 / KBS 63) TaxID=926566 RepID=I3ZFV8_TERRK|nr:flagellar hook protein FlgE [Terriglobus roseus]AFL88126.1 flagellar hook-basal body proteins [Terriglobus roseus DSM 18391]
MPSFSIALTGLQANSVALTTIGNNLANLNTTAFKKQGVNFADMFYQNIGTTGSSAPLQVGIGTRVSSIESDFSQGNLAPTGSSSDMAINGNGFFVVNQAGTNELTRAGNFQLGPTGNLITSEGYAVMGYPSVNGVVNTDAPLQAMNVPTSKTQLAHATTGFAFTSSLDSSAAVGKQFTSSTAMYDSQGTAHMVSVSFTKTASNQWSYSINMPAGDAALSTGNTGTLSFNSDGTLALPASDVTGVTFAGLSDGAADMSLSWKLREASGNSLITQSAGTSATNASAQDGYASGTYKSFAVDATGTMTATFTNGGTEILGQIAVATVTNPEALARRGSNLYAVNQASGAMDIGVAGSGDRGTVDGSTLEQSNVDISTEFADLIVAQRSFEANSKTITAFDTIMQDTINMIR